MRTLVAAILTRFGRSCVASATTRPSLLLTVLTAALSHFTYVALVVILVVAGTGVPIPEDIPLIFSGYLCNKEYSPIRQIPRMVDMDGDGIKETRVPRRIPHLYWMMVAGMVGVLAGDSIVFSIGRRGIETDNFVARHLRKVMHSKRRERVERHFARHGNMTVFVGRFMPGFRSLVFAFAGLSKMSYFRFLLIDGIAAGISVPFFIFLGFRFAEHINLLLAGIDRIKMFLTPIVLILALGAILLYIVRRKRVTRAAVE